ncbi:AT-rich interactive domain-containing protein 3C [Halotydeus destructor]|nr:AT-rich interactive domain-containing protein 3C [Halotydeus destructor]
MDHPPDHSDVDGSTSNQEEEEDDMHESDYDDDMDSGGGGGNAGINGGTNGNSLLHRIKMERGVTGADVTESVLSAHPRLKPLSELDKETLVQNERLQREVMAALQRQAAQAVATMQGTATPWTPEMPTPLTISSSVTSSSSASAAAPTASSLISSSSPGGASGSSGPTSSSNNVQSIEAGKGYTFEEQFKQLYEINDDPERKKFLDDVFSFMQKRGTPVNRIPIMAKQVLDLYELYRLVVSRGGLVEVINKKIWREITKGLNLPSSITSAAFTLRTQYMKYLYPYECDKEHLSTPDELQQAIDGNRREGRRSSYGHYAEMVGATPPPQATSVVQRNHGSSHHTSPISLVSRHVNGHNSSQGVSSGEEDNGSMSSTPTPHLLSSHSLPAQQEALNLEVKAGSGGLGLGLGLTSGASNNGASRVEASALRDMMQLQEASARAAMEVASRKLMEETLGIPASKRFLSDSDWNERCLINAGLPSAHIKVSSREGRTQLDNGSLVVSMEINGVIYQGVLFAQTSATHRSRLS